MEIRIKVGAALDANAQALFRPLVESAGRARRLIEQELGGARRPTGSDPTVVAAKKAAGERIKATKDGADKEGEITRRALSQQAAEVMRVLAIKKRAMREEAQERDRAAKAAQKAAQQEAKAAEQAAAAEERAAKRAAQAIKERERALDHVRSIRERFERNQARDAEREERRSARMQRQNASAAERQQGKLETHVSRFGWSAMRNFSGLARGATNVARDVAQGAGVDFGLGQMIGGVVNRERMAVDLANAAFMPGAAGAAGVRQDPKALLKEATTVGNFAAFDPTQVLQGLQAFVAKTGDLETGREALASMAQLARATGAELNDMVDAAGDVANALGDTDNKGAKVSSIMRVIAGQGKIGAVEIKSLATQMAKLATASTAFEGDPQDNLAMMGALVQMSRAKGGSASATQAATSVASFVNTLRTPARMGAFEEATGKKVYNEKTGMFRSPEDIILESLKATGGDPAKFKKIFANVQGARAVEGFATTYRQAGGGDVGLAAVRAEFDRFRQIAMSQGEISQSFQNAMGTSGAKVQLFNNKLTEIAERMGQKMLPALEKLEPSLLKMADGIANIASWVAENPGDAIVAAIVASIAKAGLATAVRAALEAGLRGALSGIGLGGAGLGAGGAAGAAGALGAGSAGAGAASSLGLLAGPVGAGLTMGVGAMALGGARDWAKAKQERVAQAGAAAAILDDPRQRINAALAANGINVATDAGIYGGDLRRFAATQDDADALEDARRKMVAQSGVAPGASFAISGALNERLLASAGMARSIPVAAANMTEAPNSSQALDQMVAAMKQPVAPPEMKNMLQVLQSVDGSLKQIAAIQAQQGPPTPDGAPRVGPSLD